MISECVKVPPILFYLYHVGNFYYIQKFLNPYLVQFLFYFLLYFIVVRTLNMWSTLLNILEGTLQYCYL